MNEQERKAAAELEVEGFVEAATILLRDELHVDGALDHKVCETLCNMVVCRAYELITEGRYADACTLITVGHARFERAWHGLSAYANELGVDVEGIQRRGKEILRQIDETSVEVPSGDPERPRDATDSTYFRMGDTCHLCDKPPTIIRVDQSVALVLCDDCAQVQSLVACVNIESVLPCAGMLTAERDRQLKLSRKTPWIDKRVEIGPSCCPRPHYDAVQVKLVRSPAQVLLRLECLSCGRNRGNQLQCSQCSSGACEDHNQADAQD